MRNTILLSQTLLLLPGTASAQFYTITRESGLTPESYRKSAQIATLQKRMIQSIIVYKM